MPSLYKVTVIDDIEADKCEGHCGLEFSSPQVIEQTTELLKDLFGETVQLEYLDLSGPVAGRLYPEMVERVTAENLPLPLLLINGNLRVSGYFDIDLLKRVIQADLEMEL